MENMLSDSRALKVKLGILRKLRQWCTWHLRKQKTRKNPDKQTKQNKKMNKTTLLSAQSYFGDII